MSFTIIEDGTGAGHKVAVDDHGRLSVKAGILSHEAHHCSTHQNFFVATGNVVLAGTSETPILYIKNDGSTLDMEIYWFTLGVNGNMGFEIYLDPSYTSGGTLNTSVNTNVGSTSESSTTIYEGGASADLITSGGSKIRGCFAGAYTPYNFDFKGGMIIPPTKAIVITVTGTAADTAKASLSYSFHATGTKL